MSIGDHLPSRRDTCWMLAIGSLALGLRLLYAIQYASHPIGRLLWVDEVAYWERAKAILGGQWLPDRPFYQDPLIHYLLAAVMAVVGSGVAGDPRGAGLPGRADPGRHLLGWPPGLRPCRGDPRGIRAGDLRPVGLHGRPAREGGLGRPGRGPGPGLLGVHGRTRPEHEVVRACRWPVGRLSLLRANALLVGPIGVIWWLACPGLPRGRRPKGALGFLAGFVIVLAPVSLVNLAVSRPHEFILTTWQGGAMFYTGNGPEASGVGEPPFIRRDPHLEADDFAAEAERRAGRRLTPGEVSSFWMSEGLRQWRDAPLASLRFLAFKLGLLLNDLEVPDSQSPDWVRLVAVPGLGLAFLSFGWLVPWAAIGLTRTDRSPFWWFLSTSTVVGLITTAVFFVLGRYRVPWTPGLCAPRGGRGRRACPAGQGSVLARRGLRCCSSPRRCWRWPGGPKVDPDPERWGYFQLALMVAYTQGGDLDAAIDALDDARAAASRVAASTTLLAQGWIHNQLAALVGRRWAETSKAPESALTLARLAGAPSPKPRARRPFARPGRAQISPRVGPCGASAAAGGSAGSMRTPRLAVAPSRPTGGRRATRRPGSRSPCSPPIPDCWSPTPRSVPSASGLPASSSTTSARDWTGHARRRGWSRRARSSQHPSDET